MATVVGPAAYSGAGAPVPNVRVDHFGAQVVTDAGGRYQEACSNGELFCGANQSAVALTAALATTFTGLSLANPAGSGVRMEIVTVGISANAVASAATSFGLIGGWAAAGIATHTTPITVTLYGSCLIGPNSAGATGSKGLLDAASTLVGTPRWLAMFGQAGTVATTSDGFVFSGLFDLASQFAIDPGGYFAIGATVANTAAYFLSITWRERAITSVGGPGV